MKKIITSIIAFVFPSFLAVLLLRLLGHKIGRSVKIGFSFIYCNKIEIGNHAKIGHLNLLLNDKLLLCEYAKIGYLNILKGPFSLLLKKQAALGNKNYLTRAKIGITYGESQLNLGELTKITTGHHLDLTQSIIFGDFSILAGIRSQMWTHGYYHADQGKDRLRIDGEIHIGNNVYIGSGCIFNPGVNVANAIHIGAGSVISKNLELSGMYVGQGLRYIENDLGTIQSKLKKVEGFNLVEQVYTK
ncbi:acyltransferase [Bizionia sp.]|uniref:acyltransferase n=1 Tax=Bizionia sp. TaxID=1954480 RepID=UPI003A8F7FFE